MTNRVRMMLLSEVAVDKPPALVHAAVVRTCRLSDDKRSSLVTWLVLHLQEAYCQT